MRALFMGLGLGLGLVLLGAAAPDERPPLQVGHLTLMPCAVGYGAYCGSFDRPLDPSGHTPGQISIGFEWYPRRDQADPSLGTVAFQEGGPGYSTTGSRDGYVRLFEPLRDHRDFLLMDKRGTGKSGPLACPSLQIKGSATPADYAACGQRLGPKAWFYATRFAADDLAALLDQLDVPQIDYYGDSYGTFFGQVFARLHPDRLRTQVLDSAYPDGGPLSSPWFPTEYNTTKRALREVCDRSPGCRALGGDPVERLDRLVAAVRATPLTGTAPNASGERVQVSIDPMKLFSLYDLAGNTQITWRDNDAAIRAWFGHGDSLPLLRLVAESLNSNGLGGESNREFSNALATAVICSDYPQLFDLSRPQAERQVEYDRAVARKMAADPGLYAPFTIREAIRAPFQPLEVGVCLGWPAPPPGAGPVVPHGMAPPVTTLVTNGELDTVTSRQEGRAVARMFAGSTYVVIANAIHEVAVGDAGYFVPPFGSDLARCAGPIVLQFVRTGGSADTSCAAKVRPIRSPLAFVTAAADAPLLPLALPDNAANVRLLRIASAATETVGDVVARYFQAQIQQGLGLRGGQFTFHATDVGYDFALDQVLWTQDLPVSGHIVWNQDTGDISAVITVAGAATGSLRIVWNDRQTDAQASVTGRLNGVTVAATRLAP